MELEVGDVVELVVGLEAKAPNPEGDDIALPPKTLGLDAPVVPNGDVVADARAPNPELANLSLDVLPNTDFGGFSVDDVDGCVVFDVSAVLIS